MSTLFRQRRILHCLNPIFAARRSVLLAALGYYFNDLGVACTVAAIITIKCYHL